MKLIKYFIAAVVCLALSTCSFSRQDIFQAASGQPDINLLPDGAGVFHFGSVGVFATQEQIFTVENTGSQNLEIERLYTSDPDLTQFTIDTTQTSSIVEPGNSTTFAVSFKPTSAVSFSVYLIIESNDPDDAVITVLLDGFGFGSVSPPVINVRLGDTQIQNGMGNHNFGNVEVGKSNNVEFIIENIGAADLYVGEVTLSSGDFMQFQLVSPSTPANVSPGEKTNFTIHFSPQDALPYNAEVTILSDDPVDGTYTFLINGTGSSAPVPDMVVKSGTKEIPSVTGIHDFGNVEVSNPSLAQFIIENTGTDVLNVSGFGFATPASGDFDYVNLPTYPFPLNQGETQLITIRFNPSTAALIEDIVEIDNDDPDEGPKYTFKVSGNGVVNPTPDINVKIPPIQDIPPGTVGYDFGVINVGNSSSITFEIENTGTASLSISDVKLIPVAADFALDLSSLSTTVSAGGSTIFDLIFSPTEAKMKTVSVEIANDDPDPLESPFTFTVKGEGTAPNQPIIKIFVGSQEYVDGSVYYFEGGDTVDVGDSSTEIFTIRNTGNGDLVLDGALLFSGQAQDFSQDLPVPQTLSPGGTLNFTATFTPTSAKPSNRKTKIQVFSNDENKKPYTINLSGNAK
jgi:hypothetical protein